MTRRRILLAGQQRDPWFPLNFEPMTLAEYQAMGGTTGNFKPNLSSMIWVKPAELPIPPDAPSLSLALDGVIFNHGPGGTLVSGYNAYVMFNATPARPRCFEIIPQGPNIAPLIAGDCYRYSETAWQSGSINIPAGWSYGSRMFMFGTMAAIPVDYKDIPGMLVSAAYRYNPMPAGLIQKSMMMMYAE